jgi:biotin carboxyl carrier protein
MKFKIAIDGERFEVEVEKIDNERYKVTIGEKEALVAVEEIPEIDAVSATPLTPEPILESKKEKIEKKAEKKDYSEKTITAMIPGTVTRINVGKGDRVKTGDVIVVIEAMKMENEIISPYDGTVKEIRVRKGEKVDTGDVIAIIE